MADDIEDLVYPVCPECAQGKHGNCDGTAWDHLMDEIATCACPEQRVYGMCTCCGSVEVALDHATGTRDLSGIGESAAYPTGYGCELCS